MVDSKLLVEVEESINRRICRSKQHIEDATLQKVSSDVALAVENRINQMPQPGEGDDSPLYSLIVIFIRRLHNDKYMKKNGEVNGAAFCRDAFIDKSTWTSIRYGSIVPKKETLLKLVIALRLSENEANSLMMMGSNSLNPSDPRDLVILALIDIKCYDIYDVYEVLEEYGKNGKRQFENIYDMKE
ncbi:MAG: hypothetical protein LUG86_09025 [Oscillospiraceae bacterium]|nr:hypothetical protein [Oscillospiraceae bacterium]